jgi:transcription antitermination factor NusG
MSGSHGKSAGLGKEQNESVGITDGAALQWFAVQTRYRFEKKVAAQLSQKKLGVYLPLRSENHSWSDRRVIVTTPLFPGYAFVKIDRSYIMREAVLKTEGMIGFVSFGGTVVPVPPEQIEHLQLLLQTKVPFSLSAFAHVGQRVRIRGGSLHGLEGVLLQRDKGKLMISIEAIQRSLAIELQGYELDLV